MEIYTKAICTNYKNKKNTLKMLDKANIILNKVALNLWDD